ncbi:hypothetical protein AQUSIP_02860 [Aquicella siphonis]|uniref:Uncharacterized protein n=1 Tax=Aquicella siphonis TaxID=254247 RepID=A0A5E4PEL0_9COXI|nr:hypothetical protein [Aquicella siphonis]VVC75012.1 hypothetical protein AQUSIP_02860 [Aquicella siphonis]
MARKKGGAKLNRSEIIQARLGPRLKFGSELIANKEKCTLSSLVEMSLEKLSESYKFKVSKKIHPSEEMSVSDLLELIWSSDEGVRFIRRAYILPSSLTFEEEDFFYFLTCYNYFWSFYEVKYKDESGNITRTEYRRHHALESLIEENLTEHWYALKNEDVTLLQKIPNEMGRIIPPPPGVDFEFEEPKKAYINVDGMFPIDHADIWKQNIHQLIKEIWVPVETPEGKKHEKKIVFPTPEEQKEMVDKIYQEHILWHSSSRK